ncbi:MAG: hypothetical protein IJA74_01585 [Oscillospiraceae bacterium]|nr:hypothetical protein [Oscillospiraceae bacterium]
MHTRISPCEGCTRVAEPKACENKQCKVWKAWFFRRWGEIHGYWRQHTKPKAGEVRS